MNIKKFFSKILAFVGGLFTNLDEWIEQHVQPSIETVQRIKACVASPVGDLITALIPGDLDDKIRDCLLRNLSRAIDAMHVTHEIATAPDWTSKVAKLIEYMRSQSKPVRQALYKALSVELAKQSAFGKALQAELEAAEKEEREPNPVDLNVKGHSIDLLTQVQYSKMKENVEADDLPSNYEYLRTGGTAAQG